MSSQTKAEEGNQDNPDSRDHVLVPQWNGMFTDQYEDYVDANVFDIHHGIDIGAPEPENNCLSWIFDGCGDATYSEAFGGNHHHSNDAMIGAPSSMSKTEYLSSIFGGVDDPLDLAFVQSEYHNANVPPEKSLDLDSLFNEISYQKYIDEYATTPSYVSELFDLTSDIENNNSNGSLKDKKVYNELLTSADPMLPSTSRSSSIDSIQKLFDDEMPIRVYTPTGEEMKLAREISEELLRPKELVFINGCPKLVDITSSYTYTEEDKGSESFKSDTAKAEERKIIYTSPPLDNSIFSKDRKQAENSQNKENEIKKSNNVESMSTPVAANFSRTTSQLQDRKLTNLNTNSVQSKPKKKIKFSPTQFLHFKMKCNVEKKLSEYQEFKEDQQNKKSMNSKKVPPPPKLVQLESNDQDEPKLSNTEYDEDTHNCSANNIETTHKHQRENTPKDEDPRGKKARVAEKPANMLEMVKTQPRNTVKKSITVSSCVAKTSTKSATTKAITRSATQKSSSIKKDKKLKCPGCAKEYVYSKAYDAHVSICGGFTLMQKTHHSYTMKATTQEGTSSQSVQSKPLGAATTDRLKGSKISRSVQSSSKTAPTAELNSKEFAKPSNEALKATSIKKPTGIGASKTAAAKSVVKAATLPRKLLKESKTSRSAQSSSKTAEITKINSTEFATTSNEALVAGKTVQKMSVSTTNEEIVTKPVRAATLPSKLKAAKTVPKSLNSFTTSTRYNLRSTAARNLKFD